MAALWVLLGIVVGMGIGLLAFSHSNSGQSLQVGDAEGDKSKRFVVYVFRIAFSYGVILLATVLTFVVQHSLLVPLGTLGGGLLVRFQHDRVKQLASYFLPWSAKSSLRPLASFFLLAELLIIGFLAAMVVDLEQTRETSYGPPALLTVWTEKAVVNDTRTQGYLVKLKYFGDVETVYGGLLSLSDTAPHNLAAKRITGGTDILMPVSIATTTLMEYKKKLENGEMLWALEKLDPASLMPRARLFRINSNQFSVFREDLNGETGSLRGDSLATYTKAETPDVIYPQMGSLINGIEIVPQLGYETIWLLGYDGSLYKTPAVDDVTKSGPLS